MRVGATASPGAAPRRDRNARPARPGRNRARPGTSAARSRPSIATSSPAAAAANAAVPRRRAIAQFECDDATEGRGLGGRQGHVELRLGKAALDCGHYARALRAHRGEPMQHGRPVAILGGVRIPFCRRTRPMPMSATSACRSRTLGALVEKFGLHGAAAGRSGDGRGDQAFVGLEPRPRGRAVLRPVAADPGHHPAARLRHLLDTIVTIANKIATGQIESGIGGGSDTTSDVPIVYGKALRRRLLQAAAAKTTGQAGGVQGLLVLANSSPTSRAWASRAPASRWASTARTWRRNGTSPAIRRTSWPSPRTTSSPPPTSAASSTTWWCRSAASAARQHPAPGHQHRKTRHAEAGVRQDLGQGHADRRQLHAAHRRRLGRLLASDEWAAQHGHEVLAYLRDAQVAAVDFVHGEGLLMAPTVAVAADAQAQQPDPAGFRFLRDPRSLRRAGAVHAARLGRRGLLQEPPRPGRAAGPHRSERRSIRTAPRWPSAIRSPRPARASSPPPPRS